MTTRPVTTAPVIVGVDGSEPPSVRSNWPTYSAPRSGSVLIAHIHPFKQLSSMFAPGQCERLLRKVAESTFDRVHERLRSVPEPRFELVSDSSPAAGLHKLGEAEAAALILVGSSHRSRIGRARRRHR